MTKLAAIEEFREISETRLQRRARRPMCQDSVRVSLSLLRLLGSIESRGFQERRGKVQRESSVRKQTAGLGGKPRRTDPAKCTSSVTSVMANGNSYSPLLCSLLRGTYLTRVAPAPRRTIYDRRPRTAPTAFRCIGGKLTPRTLAFIGLLRRRKDDRSGRGNCR